MTDAVSMQYLEEYDIYEFFFAQASRRAMDDYVKMLYNLYPTIKDKAVMGFIHDIHISGAMSVNYTRPATEKLFKDLQPFPTLYIAYLGEDTYVKSMVKTLDYTVTADVKRMYFPFDKRDEAIQWLVEKIS